MASAQPQGDPRDTAVEQSQPTPDVILQDGIEALSAYLSRGFVDEQELIALIKSRIAPQFDMVTMARWSGGHWYRQMTPEQQQAFTLKLAKSFFASLADIVAGYAGREPEIRFLPPRRVEGGEVDVTARVYPPRGYSFDVRFSFHKTPDGWRIFDVSANGVSAVSHYRRMFNDKVRRYGPQVLYTTSGN